jgi:hypothetical protein
MTAEQQAELYRIMMTYQWPMSVAAYEFGKITKDEAEVLFKPVKVVEPGADAGEQGFIRKKIHESALLGPDFDLIFVPKTLYELFALSYFCTLSTINRSLLLDQFLTLATCKSNNKLLEGSLSATYANYYKYNLIGYDFYKSVFHQLDEVGFSDEFTMKNRPRYVSLTVRHSGPYGSLREGEELLPEVYPFCNFYFDLNKAFAESMLSADFIRGESAPTVASIESAIYPNAIALAKSYLDLFKQSYNFAQGPRVEGRDELFFKELTSSVSSKKILSALKGTISDENVELLLKEIIYLEYLFKARNEGFLLRVPGWNLDLVAQRKTKLPSQKNPALIDTATSFGYMQSVPEPVDARFRRKFLGGHSLSFGNSLFAGVFFDPGACVYDFALENETCYALRIKKYDYVTSHCDGLFIISPLPTLGAMLADGELFHSRTLVVNPNLERKGHISGYLGQLPDFLRGDGEYFQQEWWYQMYFLENAYVIKSPISPEEFFRSARAAASAMKGMWEHQQTVEAEKKQAIKKQVARDLLIKALKRRRAAKEPREAEKSAAEVPVGIMEP